MSLTATQQALLDRMQSDAKPMGPSLCWAKVAGTTQPETLQWFASGGLGTNFFSNLRTPELEAASELIQLGFLEAVKEPAIYYNIHYRKVFIPEPHA